MKVTVLCEKQGCLFDDIAAGAVFYDKYDPYRYFLRTDDTDSDCWAAVDIKTGEMYDYDDFDHDNTNYYVVEAEMIIS